MGGDIKSEMKVVKYLGWVDLNGNGKKDGGDQIIRRETDGEGIAVVRRVSVDLYIESDEFEAPGLETAEERNAHVETLTPYVPGKDVKSVEVIGVKDMWNATSERTIDAQDRVLLRITDKDGVEYTEEVSVRQFREGEQFQDNYGEGDDRMEALAGMKQFSFDNRPVTMSLSAQDNAGRYARAILGVAGDIVDYATSFVSSPATPDPKLPPADVTANGTLNEGEKLG